MSTLLQPFNEAQLKLLELVAVVQQDHGTAPVWSYIEHEFDRIDMDATEVLSSLPFVGSPRPGNRHYGFVWTDSNIPMPGTKVYLTVAGRHRVQGIEQRNTEAFVALLQRLVTARLNMPMSPTEVQQTYSTCQELRDQAVGYSNPILESSSLEQIKMLVDYEPALASTVTPAPDKRGGWRVELRRELALYKGVKSVEQYISRVSELLTPPQVESTEPIPSPFGIVAAFDYLDVVWRLRFAKPLVQSISAERTAKLAFPVNTRDELNSQLSSMAELLKGLRIPRNSGGHPVRSIATFLEQGDVLDEAALGRVRDAAADLGAVVNIRNAQQHGGGQERGVEATRVLGLSYPIVDPSMAWQVIQRRVVSALTTLREEVHSSYFASLDA
ncbi:hypothetical protein [Actinophytocola sp.]|uniref:hypothetical protein n=1 Tax=Actinophytocola sp. TaxID=1872138 RepID=UPI002D3FC5DE|nr:hypothetical protein [Actinophytocola sp.]HYQ61956.1 hypothetical protein [Actinophytocola sp.]